MSGTKALDPIERLSGGRKLIAVVHADMVGYSRLIGLDDVGTLERLRALRRTLIDPAIDEHGGRIVSTGGDSLLIVFDSVDGAVRCVMKVQQQVPVCDGDQPPDRAIRFRAGINVGDVIPDGTDIHGDVVNVAARLQAECPPGGICVSRAVRDHVQDRLDLTFEERGALNLKNIAHPVEAFVLRLDAAATTTNFVEQSLLHKTYEPLPLPDKPSIAVLPFANLSADPEQEYFSDGIGDDIITELSRSHSLFVIARNSSFTYRGRSVDAKQAARELGVRYVVEGSVRRHGHHVRINAQLVDAIAGNHIWAERYDRDLVDIFAVQDEITTAVATAVLPAISDAEFQRIRRKPPESLGAWEAYQRGLWHLGKASSAEIEEGRLYLQRSISYGVAFAPAYAALAMTYFLDGAMYAALPQQEALTLATEWARKAVSIDVNDAEAHAMLASTALMAGDFDEGWERLSLALAINPNSSWANAAKGGYFLYRGNPSAGREALLAALRLSPRGPRNGLLLHQIAMSFYFERDYLAATDAARRAVVRYPEAALAYRCLAASLGQLGRIGEAQIALRKALEGSHQSFAQYVRTRPMWLRPVDYEHIIDGLRKAGWHG